MEGWIKLHRQVMENEFYFSERFTKIQAWIDLLLLATHKERKVFIRGVEIKLLPGQLCYSQVSLAKRWKWNRRTVCKFLKMLSKREMIHIRINSITTIIDINKWYLYQGDTQQSAQGIHSRMHTNKNGINGENILLDKSKEEFEIFRLKYPGVKRGLETEFEYFTKKTKDWKDILPQLLPLLNTQINIRTIIEQRGDFIPEWKHLKTWINNRCWEEELKETEQTKELKFIGV